MASRLNATTRATTAALVAACLLSWPGAPAHAQGKTAEALARCQDDDADASKRKAACNTVIEDKSIDAEMRAEALVNLGLAHEAAGEDQQAIQIYTELIATDAASSVAYFNRGNVLERIGQSERALGDYNKAISLDATDPDYFENRGLLLLESGVNDKALEDFDQAIKLGQNDSGVFVARATALEKLGRKADAAADYKKALDIEPGNADAGEGLKRVQ